jgi:hypothetical protein
MPYKTHATFQQLFVCGLCRTPVQNVRCNTRYIPTTARIRPLWHACAERSIQYALYFNNCSCGASVEHLSFNLIHIVFQQQLPCGPGGTPLQFNKHVTMNCYVIRFLDPAYPHHIWPRDDPDEPLSPEWAPNGIPSEIPQSPERSFLLHQPRSHFSLELLYQNKFKTTFVYFSDLIVNSQAQVTRGHSFICDESRVRSLWGRRKEEREGVAYSLPRSTKLPTFSCFS